MKNEEILQKAIEKAEANGLRKIPYFECVGKTELLRRSFPDCFYHAAHVIFSHDFAKAFWGEVDTEYSDCPFCEYPGLYAVPVWQYHLQQMVLEKDPIKYLEKFI